MTIQRIMKGIARNILMTVLAVVAVVAVLLAILIMNPARQPSSEDVRTAQLELNKIELDRSFEKSGKPIPERKCEQLRTVGQMKPGERAYTSPFNVYFEKSGKTYVSRIGVVAPYRRSDDMPVDAIGIARMSTGVLQVFVTQDEWDERKLVDVEAALADDVGEGLVPVEVVRK